MRISTLYRSAAIVLAMVMLTAWAIRSGHGWWIHAAEPAHCDLAHDGSSAHFHADSGREHSCPICAFCLAVPEIISVTVLPAPLPVLPESAMLSLYAPLHTKTAADSTFRRGPPVLGALISIVL